MADIQTPIRSAVTAVLALAALAFANGCASHETATAPKTQVAASTVPRVAPARAPARSPDAAPPDARDAVLVVSRDVVLLCPNLRAIARGAEQVEPDLVWLVILEGISDCMTDGGLRAHRIRIVGAPERRDLVRLVLATKGAPMTRVIAAPSDGHGDDDPRVDVQLVSEGR